MPACARLSASPGGGGPVVCCHVTEEFIDLTGVARGSLAPCRSEDVLMHLHLRSDRPQASAAAIPQMSRGRSRQRYEEDT